MKIGDLARRTGTSVRMLRYYEEQGLLNPARTASRYRDYGAVDEQTVNRIRMLSDAGLRIPTKPDGDSDFEAGHRSNLKPDTIPI